MKQPKRRKGDGEAADDFCQRFGAVAVHKGFVTLEEMKAAVMEQLDDDVNGREHRLLGTILSDNGLITEHQIEAVLLELKKYLKGPSS